jgi:hypothetical protein
VAPGGFAGVVGGLVQLGGRVGGRLVGPQLVDDLLAVQALARREGEHLDQ